MGGQVARARSATPTPLCYAPLGASYATGVVVCVLPRGHEGRCDGGKAERRLGEAFAASRAEAEMEHE